MKEKITLEQFKNICQIINDFTKDAENKYEEIHNNTSLTAQEKERQENELTYNYSKRYFEYLKQLSKYDLSAIPAQEWENIEFINDPDGREYLDFSNTNANIDMNLIRCYGITIFKGCNIINFESVYDTPRTIVSDKMFDKEIVDANPQLFLSNIVPDTFKEKFELHKLNIDDFLDLTDEQLSYLESVDLKRLLINLDYRTGNEKIIHVLGIKNAIKLYKYSKDDFEIVKELCTNDYFQVSDVLSSSVKNIDISQLKEYCCNTFINKIFYSKNNKFALQHIPEGIIKSYPSVFLVDVDVPEDVKERYFDAKLTISDIAQYGHLFGNLPLDNFMAYIDYSIFETFSNKFGIGKLQKYIIKYPELFKTSLDSFANTSFFCKYLEDAINKNLSEEDVVLDAIKIFYVNQIGEAKDGGIMPEWLTKMGFNNCELSLSGIDSLKSYNVKTFIYGSRNMEMIEEMNPENITKFDDETYIFSNKGMVFFKALSSNYYPTFLQQFNIDFKHGQLSYEEFKKELLKCFVGLKQLNLLNNKILTDDFFDMFPNMSLNKDVPPDLFDAFMNNNITFKYLYQHPEYIKYLKDKDITSIIKGPINVLEVLSKYDNEILHSFITEYGFIINDLGFNEKITDINELNKAVLDKSYEYMNDVAQIKIFDELTEKPPVDIIQMMLQKIQEAAALGVYDEFQEYFQDYKYTTKEDLEDKLNKIIILSKRIVNSNSLELYSFKNQFIKLLIVSKDPFSKLDEIEKIFLKNNLPLFAKMYLCFNTIYPRLDEVKRDHWGFGDNSRISPELKDASIPKVMHGLNIEQTRHLIIFNDLLRIAYRSNERNFVDYLDNIENGNDIYNNVVENNFDISSLSKEDLDTLEIFVNHLEVLYRNTKDGMNNTLSIENLSLDEKLRLLTRLINRDNIHDLKDTIIRKFCYFAGIKTFDELKQLMSDAKEEQKNRIDKLLENVNNNGGVLKLEPGDYLRGIGSYNILGSTLNGGNVCKEQLGSIAGTSESDTTPLDVDITLLSDTKRNGEPRETIYDFIQDTPTGFGFGNIYVIIKKDNPNLNVTRDKYGKLTGAQYDPKKIEMFGTSVGGSGYETHWGARTGISFADVDCIIYKTNYNINEKMPYDENGNVNYNPSDKKYFNDLIVVKFEIARNGYYIPVFDFAGKLLYTKEEYNIIRNQMQGLSYYHENTYNLSSHLEYEGINDDVQFIKDGYKPTIEKRSKINTLMMNIISEFGLNLKTRMDGDLTSGSIELIDTGSTGRYTNVPGDGDFDFFLRYDADTDIESLKTKIFKVISSMTPEKPDVTNMGDFRFKKVKLDDNTTVDIDISFGIKRNKTSYTSDACLSDRLQTIKKLYPDKYEMVVANIIKAKDLLKHADPPVYKNKRSDPSQGGLGGIGIENWILQNGGSLYDAALDFVNHAIDKETNKVKSFDDFKKSYEIWDFGENHFTARKKVIDNMVENVSLFDNFVSCNLNEKGYYNMIKTLSLYLGKEVILEESNDEELTQETSRLK
jgi:hypothetical protein